MAKKKKPQRDPNQPLLQGRDAYIARLKAGETVKGVRAATR